MKTMFYHDFKLIQYENDFYTMGSFTNELFNRYSKDFDDIELVCRVEGIVDKKSKYILEDNKLTNFKVHQVSLNYLNSLKVIKKSVLECDCAIIRLPSLIGYIAQIFCMIYKKPFLVEVVGCPLDSLWNHGRFILKPLSIISYIINKLMIYNSSHVVYVTQEFLQNRYPTRGVSIGCSDVNLKCMDKCVIENRINSIKQTKSKLIIGTLAVVNIKYKGQETVIKALKELQKLGYDFEYQLVGGGDNTYLLDYAKKLDVLDKVIFMGNMSHNQVFEWLDNIDIYIQPSRTEGLPRALIEALSRGVPAIGTNVGGIPELLSQEFIFEKGSVDELVEILKNLNTLKLATAAINNFQTAKEFEMNLLLNRKHEFYKKFLKETNINIKSKVG